VKDTHDLENAKKRLNDNDLKLCIVKCDKSIFETMAPGISGFLEAIERFEEKLNGASIADRVVGKAIALLCIYARIKGVYALTLGKEAKTVLEENATYVRWDNLVDSILRKGKDETCIFEKAVTEISNPHDGYIRLKELQDSLTENLSR